MPWMAVTTKQHGFWYHLFDVLFNIIVIVGIVAGIRTFLVSPFQVDGNSMVDTLADKEYIIINKFAYLVGDPHRGDVVVFRPPSEPSKYYVKRVIGLPGDEVIIRDGFVYLKKPDDQAVHKLDEPYLNDRNAGHTYREPGNGADTSAAVFDVPGKSYFLLGDNRQGSADSRIFKSETGASIPFVPRFDIKGRVWFIALPLTKIHALGTPQYGF
jgi:signal peptidase I